MKDMNVWVGSGRLGADPETRNLRDNDGVVVNLRIAVDNTYKDRDGKEQGNTEWVPVVLFGHGAEFADKYLRKGDKVIVRGQFRTRKWKDNDNKDRYTTEIVVDNFNGQIVSAGQAGGGGARDDRDDRDRGRDRDRDRNDDRGRDRGRDDDRGRRDDRGGRDRDRDARDDRGRDDRGGRDRDRDRDDDRGGAGRGRDDGRRESSRERMDDDIPF